MDQPRQHFFSLHELLIMAALAALGGGVSSVLSLVGKALGAAIGLPGGLQFLAGIHVFWLVLALGLIRKPGAATITGLLKGAVELLSGNPKGLIVLVISALAGVAVDAVWLLLARRNHPVSYALAGGIGAASNLLVFKFYASLPAALAVGLGLAVLAGVAFVSGALLAGLLGWWLLQALRSAGVVGAQPAGAPLPGSRRTWAGFGLLAVAIMLVGIAAYVVKARASVEPAESAAATQPAPPEGMPRG